MPYAVFEMNKQGKAIGKAKQTMLALDPMNDPAAIVALKAYLSSCRPELHEELKGLLANAVRNVVLDGKMNEEGEANAPFVSPSALSSASSEYVQDRIQTMEIGKKKDASEIVKQRQAEIEKRRAEMRAEREEQKREREAEEKAAAESQPANKADQYSFQASTEDNE